MEDADGAGGTLGLALNEHPDVGEVDEARLQHLENVAGLGDPQETVHAEIARGNVFLDEPRHQPLDAGVDVTNDRPALLLVQLDSGGRNEPARRRNADGRDVLPEHRRGRLFERLQSENLLELVARWERPLLRGRHKIR